MTKTYVVAGFLKIFSALNEIHLEEQSVHVTYSVKKIPIAVTAFYRLVICVMSTGPGVLRKVLLCTGDKEFLLVMENGMFENTGIMGVLLKSLKGCFSSLAIVTVI